MSLDRREFLVVLGAGMVLGLQTEALREDFGSDPQAMFAVPQLPTSGAVGNGPNSLAFVDQSDDQVLPGNSAPSNDPASSNEVKLFAGRNLDGWRTALGDARHTASGLEEVNITDIATHHRPESSILVANTQGRGVMAHNTTYLRRVDEALDYRHRSSLSFRTPTKPEAISGQPNAQTVEVALFVWDGANTRRDIGLALQWVINPWHSSFGAIRTWTSEGDESRWSEPVAWLEPSDEWHSVEMELDARALTASMMLDGTKVPAQCTRTTKPDNWARTTAAAIQIEIVSLWPDDRPVAPTTSVECKDWSWRWDPL